MLRYEKGPRGDMPPNVLIPYIIGELGGNLPHGDTAGFIGKAYDPFVLNADPSDPNFKVPDMLPPDYISAVRVDRRRELASGDRPVGEILRGDQSGREVDGCDLQPGLHADDLRQSARGV